VNEAFYRGFVKEALAPGAVEAAVGLGIGGLFGGLAVYDFFKGRSLPTVTKKDLEGRGAERVDARAWLAVLLKKKPLKEPPVVVTKFSQLERPLKRTDFSTLEKSMIRKMAKQVLEHGTNAFVLPAQGRDIIVIPPKIHKHVVEHELGHVRDFAKRPWKKPGILKSMLASVWKPTYRKLVMEREERAWKHTKAKKLKEKALGSYERGFHYGRVAPAALGAYLGIKEGLRGLKTLRSAANAKRSS